MAKPLANPEADQIDEATDEPVRRMRGNLALVEAVRSEAWEEFPMDHQAVDYSFGDIELEDGSGGYVPVRELTDHLARDRYGSADELLTGLSDALYDVKGIRVDLSHIRRPEDLAQL
jgi:hypothetical protein